MTKGQISRSIGNIPELPLATLRDDPSTVVLELPTPARDYAPEPIAFAIGHYATAGHGRRGGDVEVVAGELIANAAYHGNDRDPSKLLRVYCLWRQCFYLVVQDEGPGFDIKAPPFVPGKSGIPPEGGLGLAVITQRTDLVYADGSAVIAVFEAD